MGNTPNANKQSGSQNSPYTSYVATPESVTDPVWCLDTGASHHVTNDANQLQQKNKYHAKTKLVVGDGNCLPIHHIGNIVISANHRPLLLSNVIHSPNISKNLITVLKLTSQNNLCVEFNSNSFIVKDKATGKELLQGRSKDGLYHLDSSFQPQVNLTSTKTSHTTVKQLDRSLILDWHNKLGHPCTRILL